MPVCHALLRDPHSFRWLLRVDAELAGETRAVLTASSFRRNLASTVLQRSLQVGFFDFQ